MLRPKTNLRKTRMRPHDLEAEAINTRLRLRPDGDRKKSVSRGFITARS